MTPAALEARAKREEDTYGQKELPAMLRAGAEAMREVERLRAALDCAMKNGPGGCTLDRPTPAK